MIVPSARPTRGVVDGHRVSETAVAVSAMDQSRPAHATKSGFDHRPEQSTVECAPQQREREREREKEREHFRDVIGVSTVGDMRPTIAADVVRVHCSCRWSGIKLPCSTKTTALRLFYRVADVILRQDCSHVVVIVGLMHCIPIYIYIYMRLPLIRI